MTPPFRGPGRPAACRAFSLAELLVVVGIMLALASVSAPAVKSLGRSSAFASAAYGVAAILEQARAEAMRKGTYVYVGVAEVDGSGSVPTPGTRAPAGSGRLALGVIESNDGTSQFDAASNAWNDPSHTATPVPFAAASRIQLFQDVHLAEIGSTSGGMSRTLPEAANSLGNASASSDTPFTLPVGSTLGGGQYRFDKVIQFGPQGAARIVRDTASQVVPLLIEIGLQPARGNVVVAGAKDVAAVQVAGVTGAVRVYRP